MRILDQTLLPSREIYRNCRDSRELVEAIRALRIRGAPALGIAGAMGVAQAAWLSRGRTGAAVVRDCQRAGKLLAGSRPTAVNLSWGVRRATDAACRAGDAGPQAVWEAVRDEALAVASEDAAACDAMAANGLGLLPAGARVYTHCNTGALVTGGRGTALGLVIAAHEAGRLDHVWVGETRPLLQGARLTAWELSRAQVPHSVVVDGAAASLMARGEVDLVAVGADRIAANGDVANKIGTYSLAVLAHHHHIPFYVVAPWSTVDLSTRSGADIPVEERDPAEVHTVLGKMRITPMDSGARNPAFDVTPASLVSAIVTDLGVVRPPYRSALARLERLSR